MEKLPNYTWSSKTANLETKTTLSREGLRLAEGQQPCGRVRGRYEWYDLYDRDEAIPKRPASAAQLEVLKKASAAALAARMCKGCRQVMQYAGQLDEDGVCQDCALQRLIIQAGHEAAAWFKDQPAGAIGLSWTRKQRAWRMTPKSSKSPLWTRPGSCFSIVA